MWKKKENESPTPAPIQRPEPPAAKPAAPPRRAERAIIGPTLRINGELTGEEEIVVQGQIDGKIRVKGQGVTVGKSGNVKADIYARTIRIEGKVRGDLFGEQEVVIETSGDVEGNLIAPSVRLENGSRFKGSIDMEQAKKAASPPMAPKPQPGPGPTAGPPGLPGDQPTSPKPPTGPGPHNSGS